MHTEKEKSGGILDFLFGRKILKDVAAGTSTPKTPAPIIKNNPSDHDYLRRQIEATTTLPKPVEPPKDAIRTLGAPAKSKKKK